MKNRRERAKEVRRRKVAQLAAYSRQYTVKNCTVPNIERHGTGEWDIPEEEYPQPKTLRKKYKKKYYKDDGTIRKIVTHPSDYDAFPDHTFHPKGRAWYMEQMVQHKIAKWEKKNPCPIKQNDGQQDLFEQEYLVPWKAERELAIERIRDFVVSVYDKLPLTGRFQKSENKFVEENVAVIKDLGNEGHHINDLDSKKSKLLKIAQKKTNETKIKHKNLICTNLKDHKRQKGRILLPKAA